MCRRLGFRERRFSAFFEGAHFLAGERDRETHDFWSEVMDSEAWSLDRARMFFQEPAGADAARGMATLETGVAV